MDSPQWPKIQPASTLTNVITISYAESIHYRLKINSLIYYSDFIEQYLPYKYSSAIAIG